MYLVESCECKNNLIYARWICCKQISFVKTLVTFSKQISFEKLLIFYTIQWDIYIRIIYIVRD